MATRKQLYDIALNSQGFILASEPRKPQIVADQEPVYGQRFAQGDRDYDDFAKYWYMAQTDWSGGFKDTTSWENDAKYYYSSNIDTFSEIGAIKLAAKQVSQKDFAAAFSQIYCGGHFTVNSVLKEYIGTDDNASSKPVVYRNDGSGTWTDVSSAWMATSANVVSQMNDRLNYLWVHTVGIGNADVVETWDGTTAVDQGALIQSKLGWAGITSSRTALKHSNGKYYVFCDDTSNKTRGLVSCVLANPSAAADYTIILNISDSTFLYIASCEFNGLIYYLANGTNIMELRVYDPVAATDASVATFRNTSASNWGSGNLLQVLSNKLYITIPTKSIWTLDTDGNLTRVYRKDDYKLNSLYQEAHAYLSYGAVASDNKLFWGNLVTDGTYFHNWLKDATDAVSNVFFPIFVDQSDNIWGIDIGNGDELMKVTGGSYKGTADKNYLVFSNFDRVSGIDKLAVGVTLIFKTLISGQKIAVEYTTGELTTSTSWTALGNANFTSDGGITQKVLYFGDSVTFKKIWFRVKLEAGGSDTPILYDFVFSYLPYPDYKLRWAFTVKCQDEINRKDNSKEPKTGLWLRNLLRNAWLTKSVLSFEDYDAASEVKVSGGTLSATNTTVTITPDTDNFPERGRLLIESEEISYTGKTKTTFTGCTRGARGTLAASHSNATAVSMAYRTIIRGYKEQLMIANDPRKSEYLVSMELSEI